MALKEAGIRLTLQGAAEYRAGLKGIANETKLLATQSKLAIAQLGNNAKITDTYKATMKGLDSQLQLSTQKTEKYSAQQLKLQQIYKDLPSKVDAANKAYKESNKETTALERQYKKLANSMGEEHEATQKAKKAWQDSKKVTNSLKQEYNALAKELKLTEKELAKLPNELAKSELATQRLRNEAQRLHEEYRNQGGWAADYAKNLNNIGDTLVNVGGGLKNFGASWTRNITAPIIAGGATVIKAAMDWETAFTGVRKTNDEVVDSNGKVIYSYADLEKGLRGLAKTTPMSHTELAGLAETLGQLGIPTDDVVEFTDVIAKMGVTTNLSSEEAATAMAQFLNITQSGNDTVSNLGSSIVELGNNMATTERDILMMSQRWATTGKQIGLADHQMMAISATLLSMGVNVEAGGSALQRFGQKVNSAVIDGGEKLNILAKTSGVTAEEFATAWREKPAKAMQMFFKGLNKSKEAGDNVNATLKELGITSVNELNALLALAGGHELLGKALTMSENAYAKNTALSEEAAKAYETTASKLQVFWNKLKDIAITLGGPLLDALTSALDAAEPWIDKAAQMAEGFANMDEEGQRNILMWAGVLAAIGPVASVLGSIITVVGKTSNGFATLLTWLGKVTTAKTAVGASTTLLSGSLSGLLVPLAGVLAGVTALYLGYQYLNSDTRKAAQAQKDFPDISGITHAQAESIREMSDEVNNLNVQMGALSTETDMSGVTRDISNLGAEIKTLNDEKLANLKESFAQLPASVQEALQDSLNKTIQNIEDQTNRVEQVTNRMNEIAEKAIDNHGKIPERYLKEVNGLTQEMLGHYAVALGETAEQTEQIYTTLTAKHAQMNDQQLLDRRDFLKKSLDMTNEKYDQERKAIHNVAKETGASYQELNKALLASESNRNAEILALQTDMIHTGKEMFNRYGEELGQTYEEMIDDLVKQTGLSKGMVEAIWNSKPVYFGALEQGALEAMNKVQGIFNDMEINPGEINTENIDKFVSKMDDMGLSWAELELLSKDANVDDNTKEFINRVAEANGGWEKVLFDEKQANISLDDKSLIKAIKSMEDYNAITIKEKIATLSTMGHEEIQALLKELGLWDNMSPEQKEVIANAQGTELVEEVIHAIENWNTLSPQDKAIHIQSQVANQNLQDVITQAGLWNNTEFQNGFIQIDTTGPQAEQEIINLVNKHFEAMGLPPISIETISNAPETESDVVSLKDEASSADRTITVTATDNNTIDPSLQKIQGWTAAAGTSDMTMTATAQTRGVDEATQKVSEFGSQADANATKSVSLTSNLFGMVANLVTIGLYNTAINAMSDKTVTVTSSVGTLVADTASITNYNTASSAMKNTNVTATTIAPGITTRTSEIDAYNKSSSAMKNTSATATTSTPSMVVNTANVNAWNKSTSAMRNASSTATTRTPGILGNTSALRSWNAAMNAMYNRSSTATTYIRTVHQTIREHATGGHIPMFAKGGNISRWGGMFANGGNVPQGYTGIVGEAGPEIFQVSRKGVSITPLSTREKMRGIKGVLEEQGGAGQSVVINVNIDGPVVKEEQDLKRLARTVGEEIERNMRLKQLFKKGRLAT